MKTCFNCLYYSEKYYCSCPASSINNKNLALDLDPVIEKHGELPADQLASIGWAEMCDFFTPAETVFYWRCKEPVFSEF